MVLVDTSVWISHLRKPGKDLALLLQEGSVVCHPFIIGELACGNLKNRKTILALLGALPAAEVMAPAEVLPFIENNSLMGKGLGFVDVHLLGSVILHDLLLWTMDTRLKQQASLLQVAYK